MFFDRGLVFSLHIPVILTMILIKLFNQLIDLHTVHYNILLLSDFNMTPESLKLQDLCDIHDLENFIKERTCFEGINSTYINLRCTNQKKLFIKFKIFIMSISDFLAL